jgi:hypothetical protein
MTVSQKKLKHLSATMLHWAEENKIQTKRNGNYEIPQRNRWKNDFTFVTKLDFMLADGLDDKLKKKEMEMCNELYSYYRQCYMRK